MSAVHPLFAEIISAHARVTEAVTPKDEYRGWAIAWDYGRFTAVSPNYDASYEGPEDGWMDNSEKAEGRTREELCAEIDAWFEEHSA